MYIVLAYILFGFFIGIGINLLSKTDDGAKLIFLIVCTLFWPLILIYAIYCLIEDFIKS